MKLQLLGGWWAGLFWWEGCWKKPCLIRRFYEEDELVVWMLIVKGVELRFFKPGSEEVV